MAAPVTTKNAKGNVLNNASIAASANDATSNVDLTAKFKADFGVEVAFGTVAATAGLQVDVYRRIGSGPANDTIACLTFIIPATTSTTKDQSFSLENGNYNIKLTNLDATNGVTGVYITSNTLDAIT